MSSQSGELKALELNTDEGETEENESFPKGDRRWGG